MTSAGAAFGVAGDAKGADESRESCRAFSLWREGRVGGTADWPRGRPAAGRGGRLWCATAERAVNKGGCLGNRYQRESDAA
jgi:hypothetical protein